jgi:transcriptional regulator with XRE-family HTH domain
MHRRRTILKRFGVVIRSYRRKMGLTQFELGNLVGIHRTYVGAIERGERNLTIMKVCEIAEVLGKDLSVIWKEISS